MGGKEREREKMGVTEGRVAADGESDRRVAGGEGDGMSNVGNEFRRGDSGAIMEFRTEGFALSGNPVRRTWAVSVSQQGDVGNVRGVAGSREAGPAMGGGRDSGIGISGEVWRGGGRELRCRRIVRDGKMQVGWGGGGR